MSYHVSEQHEQKRFVVYSVFHFIVSVQLIGWCDVRLSRSDLFFFFCFFIFYPLDRTLCSVVLGCWPLLPKVSFDTDNSHCKPSKTIKSNIKIRKSHWAHAADALVTLPSIYLILGRLYIIFLADTFFEFLGWTRVCAELNESRAGNAKCRLYANESLNGTKQEAPKWHNAQSQR